MYECCVCAFMTFYTMLNGHLSESEHHHHDFFYAFKSSKKATMETAIYCQWKLPIGSNNHNNEMVARNEKRIEIQTEQRAKHSERKKRTSVENGKTETQDDEYFRNGACVLCSALFCFVMFVIFLCGLTYALPIFRFFFDDLFDLFYFFGTF